MNDNQDGRQHVSGHSVTRFIHGLLLSNSCSTLNEGIVRRTRTKMTTKMTAFCRFAFLHSKLNQLSSYFYQISYVNYRPKPSMNDNQDGRQTWPVAVGLHSLCHLHVSSDLFQHVISNNVTF